MKEFRVLIIEPAGNLWGSEQVLLDFLRHVDQSKCRTLVCCPPNTPILQKLENLPVEISSILKTNLHQSRRPIRLIISLKLLVVAFSYRPLVIYVNQAGASRMALFVGRILRIPVVTHVRLTEDVGYVASLDFPESVLSHIICISRYIHDLFDSYSSNFTNRLTVLYDIYTFQVSECNPKQLDQIEPTVVCVGRVVPIKGQDILLHALAILRDRGVSVRCLFLGNSNEHVEYEKQLKQLALSLEIEKQIQWLGFQSNVLQHMADKTALVCPSYNEPMGRVILEAWDAGILPVAWSGSGGASEIIRASEGGLLYRSQTGESLAETLKQVIALEPVDKDKMIQQGRFWLMKNCEPRMYTQKMISIWQSAAGIT